MNRRPISRRNFLRLSGLAAAAAALPPVPLDEAPPLAQQLGRAIRAAYTYDRPSFQARALRLLTAETVFSVYDTVTSEDEHYNRTWYRVRGGYVHSGDIQPVRWLLQEPAAEVPPGGFLGEVSIPYTAARTAPRADADAAYRCYYSTTYWATEARAGKDGELWYRVFDERLRNYYWINARHLRRVLDEEVAPLAPSADKRIDIDLEKQTFRCFENGALVLDVLCSTGPYLRTENGRRIFGTPSGEWSINRKRATRHMAGDDFASADFFDLPGVPWVSYFHWWGVSIHGTYWHNDYGKPRSHGCINLPPEAAKWVYRWSLPRAPLSDRPVEGAGTQVNVF